MFYKQKLHQMEQQSLGGSADLHGDDLTLSKAVYESWRDLSDDQRQTMITLAVTETASSRHSDDGRLSDDLLGVDIQPMCKLGTYGTHQRALRVGRFKCFQKLIACRLMSMHFDRTVISEGYKKQRFIVDTVFTFNFTWQCFRVASWHTIRDVLIDLFIRWIWTFSNHIRLFVVFGIEHLCASKSIPLPLRSSWSASFWRYDQGSGVKIKLWLSTNSLSVQKIIRLL